MTDEPKQPSRRELTQQLLADRSAIEGLLSEVAAGLSLRDACVIKGVVYSTIQMHLTQDEELRPLYEAARIRQAEAVLDEIREIEKRVEGVDAEGEPLLDRHGNPVAPLDPKAAAVLIGSKQWRAERLNPKRYGQRSYQHVEHVDKTQLHLEALRQLTQQRQAKVIEGRVLPDPVKEPATLLAPPASPEQVGPLVRRDTIVSEVVSRQKGHEVVDVEVRDIRKSNGE